MERFYLTPVFVKSFFADGDPGGDNAVLFAGNFTGNRQALFSIFFNPKRLRESPPLSKATVRLYCSSGDPRPATIRCCSIPYHFLQGKGSIEEHISLHRGESSCAIVIAGEGFYEWDVSAVARDWQCGDYLHKGLLFYAEQGDPLKRFEAYAPGKRAQLEICTLHCASTCESVQPQPAPEPPQVITQNVPLTFGDQSIESAALPGNELSGIISQIVERGAEAMLELLGTAFAEAPPVFILHPEEKESTPI